MKSSFFGCLVAVIFLIPSAFPQGRGGSGRAGRGAAPANNLVSPEVHPDRTVTFRVRAPQAQVVTVTGDWLATTRSPDNGIVPMTKDADGVWSYTSAPLEATVHLYTFTIDGLNMADPINPKVKLRVRTSGSLVEVPGDPVPVWQARDVPHGSVDWNSQHSAVYGDMHEFLVYLPPGYHTGKARYPVLYLVHGANDTAITWTMAGNANFILDSLIAEKKARPMIVVMPFNGSNAPALPAGGRAGLAGALPDTPFEDYMLQELIPYVDANYRVAPGRQNRAMAGVAAGGTATYNIAFKHTELFSSLGLFSAAGGGGADFATNYPQLVADPKGTSAKLPVIWIGCGTVDPADQGAKALDAELTKAQIKHIYKDRDGGHVWPVWRSALAEFAPLLFQKG